MDPQRGDLKISQLVAKHGPGIFAFRGENGTPLSVNAQKNTPSIHRFFSKLEHLPPFSPNIQGVHFHLQGWITEDHTTVLLDDELDEMFGVGDGSVKIFFVQFPIYSLYFSLWDEWCSSLFVVDQKGINNFFEFSAVIHLQNYNNLLVGCQWPW